MLETSSPVYFPMSYRPVARRIQFFAIVTVGMLLLFLGAFGWWATLRVDAGSLQRQAKAVARGLAEIEDELPVEQDSSAIWDDAVLNLRAGNGDWIAENVAEWMSEYFGHNRVYILGPDDLPVRAVSEGLHQPNSFYERDRRAVEPLVQQLRSQMADVSAGLPDSTAAVTGLGALDRAELSDGTVGIVSVRPIVPEGDGDVAQAPGTEYLHVSVKVLDASASAAIGEHFNIEDLRFERLPRDLAGRASSPVVNRAGVTLGYFTWQPYRPGTQLVQETSPILAGSLLAFMLCLALLLRRLQRTSAKLELSEAEAHYLAFHDPLARIPNRALFEDRLERAIAGRRRTGSKLAVHSIDLDHFKRVNDSQGHPAGDELIRQVAERLTALISEIDTVARVGGDEFTIIQLDVREVADAVRLAQQVISELERPFDLDGQETVISASMGIMYSDDVGHEADVLLRNADIALYEAKTNGRSRYQLFAGELDQNVRERRQLERDLRDALVGGGTGLELVYQPIYDTTGGFIVGAEALVRWEHPTRGRMAPDLFIGLAEERGLIDQLGSWVLREAATFAKGSTVPWVAVNVSPLQFRDERFGERTLATLAEIGLQPERLEIEITEGLLLQNSPVVQSTLQTLRAGGIRVALDDFGTGYSSISYLRTYGIDKLKIDQSFVAQLGRDTEIDSIVRSIIDLARAMHMQVTAEGVETAGQHAVLGRMGCDQFQGYLLSRPVTPVRLEEMLASKSEAMAAR